MERHTINSQNVAIPTKPTTDGSEVRAQKSVQFNHEIIGAAELNLAEK